MKNSGNLNVDLMQACKNGNLDKIGKLLEQGANIDYRDSVGCTPLWVACWKNWTEVVQFLLNQGADVDHAKNNGATPLYIACELGSVELVTLLVDAGADIDKAMKDSSTPLYISSQHGHSEVVRFLLKNGANIFSQRRGGSSPLYIASQKGHEAVVTDLLHYGADADGEMDDGSSPLYIAGQFGHLGIVQALLKHGADPKKAMNDLSTPLYIAAQNGYAEIVSVLKAHGADPDAQMNDGTTPLYIACQNGRLEVVQTLMAQGCALDLADAAGVTPLWIAAQNGHVEIARLLVQAGADVDRARANGDTALVRACDNGHGAVVAALVKGPEGGGRGADVNRRAGNGKTALHYAAWRGDRGAAKLLCDAGAEVDLQDAAGFTPLAKAANYGRLEVAALLLERGATPGLAGWNENTGLHLAAHQGYQDVVELFLGAGVTPTDFGRQNVFGATPLHLAAGAGHEGVCRQLLAAGAPPATPDADGQTPLHAAARGGHLEACEVLLPHCRDGAARERDKCGRSPAQVARSQGHRRCAEALARAEAAAAKGGGGGKGRGGGGGKGGGGGGGGGGVAEPRAPAERFAAAVGRHAKGVELAGAVLLPAARLRAADALPPYDLCRRKGWHVGGAEVDAAAAKILFAAGSWGARDDPEDHYAQFKVVKEFLEQLDEEIDYVWLESSCLCPRARGSAAQFDAQRRALPAALFAATHVLLVPQVTFAPSSSDAGRLIPFTDLIGYSGSPWGALGVMAALAARAPAWLAFQCGDHIAFEELNRLEACSIEVGFLRAVVAQWNHLMNAQHADFADLVPVLSSKWLDMEEPILQVRAVIDAGKEAEVDVGTLARVCRLQLRAVDFRPGNSSAAVQELARRLGPHEDAEERAFLLNLVLLLGYYAIGLLDSTENGPIAHAEPDESGCAACFLGSGDGEKGQCILS